MNRKQIFGFVCAMVIGLVGCGHQHMWIEATCEEPMRCQKCNATEGEPLGHTWVDATDTAPKTCSVCGKTEGDPLPPEAYCEKNQIVFEKLEDMELPFAAAVMEDGKPVEVDGFSIEHGNAYYSFGEIRRSPSQKAGYVDIVIPYQVNISMTYHQDISKFDGAASGYVSFPDFDVGDYYTGLIVLIEETTDSGAGLDISTVEAEREYEWGGNTYSITYSKSAESNWYGPDWSGSGDLYQRTRYIDNNYVMKITIPEDYDGAVLRINRAKTEVTLPGEEVAEEDDTYLLDKHGAEEYIFYRLSDLAAGS